MKHRMQWLNWHGDLMNRLFLRKTFRDIRQSWAQTLALAFIVALGVASYIGLISSYRDLSVSYERTYRQLKFADVTFAVAAAPASVLDDILAVPGVTAVSGRLIRDTGLELADGEPIRSRLIGLPATGQPDVNQVVIEEGRYLQPEDQYGVLVESHFATIHQIEVGDTISPILNGELVPFEVVGIATSPEYLMVSPGQQDIFPSARTFAVLFMPLATVQQLSNTPDMINDVSVLIQDSAAQAAVIASVQEQLAPYQVQATTLQANQTSNNLLQQDLAGYAELAQLMPSLILLVAAISVYVMLGRMVKSQQPQVGLMKALGYSTRDVLWHYLTFALVIGLAGLILGTIFGVPLAGWIVATYARELSIPYVQSQFYPELILQSTVICLLLCLLAGYGPARGSARLAPATAMLMDPSMAIVNGRASIIERLISFPLELRLPLRNVFRMRRRSFTTGLGIVFAFILVLMVWGMFDSLAIWFDHNFEEVERWDVTAVFDQPQTAATLALVRSWDDVITAEPLIQAPVTLRANGISKDVFLTAFDLDQDLHVLQLPKGDLVTTVLGDNQMVLADSLFQEMGLSIGDQLEADTPLGEQTFTVSSTTDELLNTAVYISRADALALSPLPMDFFTGLYLEVTPGSDHQVKADLYRLPGAAGVQLKSDMQNDLLAMMNLFYVFMGIMLFFALGMAFALLFNATTVNVLERQRELATMRSIGTGRSQISRQIAAESFILWLITLIPGLLLGTWVALQMGSAFSSELFTFDIVISPLSYFLTSVGILLTILIAAWPAMRRVNRLNLAEATKVLS